MSGDDDTVPIRPRERPDAAHAATQPAENPEPVLPRGTAVGRYLLLEPLGEGGMGVVYAAYDPELDRRIAVKLLHVAGGSRGSGGEGRLQREAQAMARLTHPNVVAVFDVGAHGDSVFIAMELVEGWTLRAWQRQPGRTTREKLEAYLAAGRGLAAAHAAGLVHRDFKADNVLVGRDRRILVTDFGLVRAAHAEEASDPAATTVEVSLAASGSSPLAGNLTAAGAVLGTPRYMAPEQHEGRVADARSDQFSYCASAWEALTGVRPFAGETLAELAESARRGGPARLPAGVRLPARLVRALSRGMAVDPEQRWPSMPALLLELEAAVRRRGRTNLGLAAAALVVLVVAVVAWRGGRAAQASPCLRAGEPMEARWNPALRDEVRAAFAATDAPFAADAFASASQGLEGFAARWSAMARESCVATRVSHVQSDRLGDRRAACLAERLDEAGALVERLRRADRQTALRAVELVGLLPDLEPCADVAALESRAPRPIDPGLREVETGVAGLRAELGEGKKLDPARAAQLVRRAEALGWAPLLSSALVARGKLEQAGGDGKAARASLLDAAAAALRGGDDEALADALLTLVGVDLELRTAQDDAASSLGLADAAVSRLAEPGRGRLRVHHERGLLLIARAEHVAAVAELGRALALTDERPEWRGDRLRLLLDYGLAVRGSGDLEGAAGHMAKAETLGLELHGASHPRMANVYHDHAVILFDLGRYAEARLLAEKSYAIREKLDDERGLALDLELLGGIDLRLGRFDQAQAEMQRAIDIHERIVGPEHLDTAAALSELGGILHARGDHQRALDINRRVLAIREKTLGADHPDIGYTLVNLAVESKALGRMAEVESNYRRALAIFTAKLGPDHYVNVVVWNNLGETLRVTGRLAEALEAYEEARRIADKSLPADHPIHGHVWNGIGQAELARGRPAAGVDGLEKALALREKRPGEAAELAETRFALARALVAARGDEARARRLASDAQIGYDRLGPAFARQAEACAAWLAKR